ncbi:CG11257 [Drosophila busckii]|uniref:CG11257 n=1 Tax=Drosophila busckii TaxID=30019 RepID=A0A0M4ED91_DROBS|nr:cytochrome b5 reductase 4 [Drosophila busckii]ALC41852.1 CG11257 [Drosophila busckii]
MSEDSMLKPPTINKLPTLKPPAVTALAGNSLQLPSTAQQKLNNSANGASTGSATGNPRNKCALKPGYSLMNWIRLCNSGADLSGTAGRVVPVSRSELAKHNQVGDAWMAIRGKVFNVTRYMDFHPGGVDELMRGVGRDATKLFDEVHAWVNYPQLLGKCYVGPLLQTAAVKKETLATDAELMQAPLPPTEIAPRFDWIQQRSELTLCFYTRRLANPGLLLKRQSACELELRVLLAASWHVYKFQLNAAVDWPPKSVRVGAETGKVEVTLAKQLAEPWSKYGTHESSKLEALDELHEFEVLHCAHFNHDSFELSLQSVQRELLLHLPVGYHLDIEVPYNGELLQRSYTPVSETWMTAEAVDSCLATQHFLIKHYEAGPVSSYLHELKPGARLQLSLPRGNFRLSQLEKHRNILLLAAGSGLTPILSVIPALLKRNSNRIERLQLLYFNKTQQDIWLQEKLQALQLSDERFTCQHILTQEAGRISQLLLEPHFKQSPAERFTFVAMCGPTGFNSAALDILTTLNIKTTEVHVFQA